MFNKLNILGHKIASCFGEKEQDHGFKSHFKGDSLASILPWVAYDEENALFINKSSAGFVIEAIPIIGCSEATEKELANLFQDILQEGDSLQFLLWADHRINPFLDSWEQARENASEIYRRIAQRRVEHFKGTPTRIFRCIISYSHSINRVGVTSSLQTLKAKKEKLLKLCKSFTYAFPWDMRHFLNNVSALVNFSMDSEAIKRSWNPYQTLSEQLPTGGALQVKEDTLEWQNQEDIAFKSYRAVDFPDEWSIHGMQLLIGDKFREAFRVKEPFYIHYGVHCPKQSSEESRYWKKSHLIEKQGRSQALIRFIPELARELKECDHVRRSLHQQEKFISTQLSAGVWAPKSRLPHAEQSLKSLFRINHFSLVENRFLHLPQFLASLPMTWSEYITDLKNLNLLRTTLSSEGVNLVPIQGEWIGTSSSGMLLQGRCGQLANWNPFDNRSGNYNVVVVGRSGSGKSVFMQDLILSGLSTGAKVFVLEVGRSFEKTCDILAGQSIQFGKGSPLCLNPFTAVSLDDEEEQNTSFSFIKSVISCMASPSQGTSDFENSLIEKAIHEVWSLRKNEATISDIASWLTSQEDSRAKTIGIMLTPYTKTGVYAKYFEGACNVNFTNPMVLIELEELKEKKDLQSVVLQLFIIAITNQAFLGDRKTPFYICIDEAWDLLRGKQTGVFIETLARRLRKYRGSLVIGTQSVDDFFTTPGALAAFENSDWMCLLAQKQSSINRLAESGKLDMREEQRRALESVTTLHGEYSEVMICDANGNYSIQKMILDPFSQLLYSTKAEEYAQIKELQASGLTLIQAIESIQTKQRKS